MQLNRFAVTEWREERGLSKSELAVAAQISLSYLSEIESGKNGKDAAASASVIRRIADALKVNVRVLILNPNDPEVVPSAEAVA